MRRESFTPFWRYPMVRRILAGLLVLLTLGLGVARGADEPAAADRAAVVRGNNRFALELYARLRQGEGNLFLSPYSISAALAMTSAGARGRTLEQMTSTLHLPEQGQLHPAMADLIHHADRHHAGILSAQTACGYCSPRDRVPSDGIYA